MHFLCYTYCNLYLGDWTKLSELVFSLIAGVLTRHFGCTLLAGYEIAVPLSQQSHSLATTLLGRRSPQVPCSSTSS